MKKIGIVFLTICMVFTLVGCNVSENNVDTSTDAYQFKQDYESYNESENAIVVHIDENSPIKNVSIEEVFSLLQEKTGVLYLGFPTCPWCRNMIESLIAAAKEEGVEISYFNPRTIKDTENEKYEELKKVLEEYLETNSEGEKTLYVPDVYFIKDGTIMGHHLGTLDTQTNPYNVLTESEKEELKTIYVDYIKQIK